MFDTKWIRDNPEAFDEGLKRRGVEPQAQALIALDDKRRATIAQVQEAQTKRNAASKEIGQAKAAKDEARAQTLMSEVAALKDALQAGEQAERAIDEEIREALSVIPNLPLADVPEGDDESANVEVRRHGEPRAFDFEPRHHYEIGEARGEMDFETAARMSGARFVALRGGLARLERALTQFMIDLQTETHGYEEVSPPFLVRDPALYGTGQLPKFADDLFRAGEDHWLIPTAEVPLTNLVREQIVAEESLPRRVTAATPCFRSEAGAAGRDMRGMIRLHQFTKVELVSITTPETSDAELERMTGCAEEVLKRLDLPYRVMVLSSGDMGFTARKTYDLEVWLPAQKAYREISSCSTCGDFQARRMNARYRKAGGKEVGFVHTLNGSGLAVGRALIAVIENHQRADGAIAIPDALRPYLGGRDVLGAA